jgi:GTP cyclohydrolase I
MELNGIQLNSIDTPRAEAAIRSLLEALGEDVEREGLQETPARVARMYAEFFSGMNEDPTEHIKLFSQESAEEEGGLVIVRDIPVVSMCEHHLLPFFGRAHIAYRPTGGQVIGLSKLARIVSVFARRPQVQERLTAQIADFLYENLPCSGAAVAITAEHTCMTLRGIKAMGAVTDTRALRGDFLDGELRREVLEALRG